MRLLKHFAEPTAKRLGIFPGTFNPATNAHLALARAALRVVDQVLLVLPGKLPHKTWEGATAEQRLRMLDVATADVPGSAVAISEGGLFIDMVREARLWYPESDFHLICGRDAAERIIGWDYGEEGAIERMLQEFRILVAPRAGHYEPPAHVAHAVDILPAGCWDDHSSTRVREALTEGGEWRSLVPESIHQMVEEIYRPEG